METPQNPNLPGQNHPENNGSMPLGSMEDALGRNFYDLEQSHQAYQADHAASVQDLRHALGSDQFDELDKSLEEAKIQKDIFGIIGNLALTKDDSDAYRQFGVETPPMASMPFSDEAKKKAENSHQDEWLKRSVEDYLRQKRDDTSS